MKFKCILSGNIVEFNQDFDIKTMLDHPQYVVVEEPVKKESEVSNVSPKKKQ